MEQIELRRAVAGDSDGLTECIRAAYAAYDGRISDLPDVTAGIAEDIARDVVWIAESGGAIVGGLVMRLAGDVAHIANLAVHPDGAGAGLGKRLMRRAEEQVHDAGVQEMRLATHVDLTEVQAFYARLGWSEFARAGNKVEMAKTLRR